MSKLLTTLALVSVVSIAGCSKDEFGRNAPDPANLKVIPLKTSQKLQVTVPLGIAGKFVILAEKGITTTGITAITGDIGVSPITATAITGFGLIMDVSNSFSTSSLVTGKVYAADYAVPTPTKMTAAVSDMELAYVYAAGRAPDVTELNAGDIGGLTLAPGVYKWGTGLLIPTNVTLAGGPNAIWIFQVAGTLTMSPDIKIILSGGAQARNIFWQVADVVALQDRSHFEGIILGKTNIVLQTGASINGRTWAQTAVTLATATVTRP